MDLGRTPPPFFKQGPSAFSRLVAFAGLSVVLMLVDARYKLAEPLRRTIASALYPIEMALRWPIDAFTATSRDVQALRNAQLERDSALRAAQALSARAQRVELLDGENERLRELLELKKTKPTEYVAGEVIYENRDPFTRRFVLDRGQIHGIKRGIPVIDASGVVGQITRVNYASSEITAVSDKEMAIPVQNSRTGIRGVVYGDAVISGAMELRFTAANADVKEGDVLVSSGLDGVYPPGLHVARVSSIERQAESPFARIVCMPLSGLDKGRFVLAVVAAPNDIPKPVEPAPVDPRAKRPKAAGSAASASSAASAAGTTAAAASAASLPAAPAAPAKGAGSGAQR